jgi:enoyl-CoA hydratase
MSMSYEHLVLERAPGYAIITLDRPRQLNALNSATIDELGLAIDELASDEQTRAVVITGAGDRAFVAGADIGEINAVRSAGEGTRLSETVQRLFFKLSDLPLVFIAAINGYALGGGFELALACDLRLAADTAQLGLPEVSLGLIPGWGGTQRLLRLIGPGMAKYLVLTGSRIGAEEARSMGLVEQVYPAHELLGRACDLAATIASMPPLAIAAAKRLISTGHDLPLRDACSYESVVFGQLTVTDDAREGTTAFLEKRRPQWRGR